jgi:hypothetical protein
MKEHALFPILVYTDNIILDISTMINYLYNIKQIDKGVNHSNRGGWQSKPNLHNYVQFFPLVNYIKDKFKKKYNIKINLFDMWGNISSKYHYNTIHHHGKIPNIWSGIYYLQIYDNSGCLNIYSECNMDHKKSFYFKKGDLIIFPSSLSHSVEANLEDKDRISIAFNFQINPKNG